MKVHSSLVQMDGFMFFETKSDPRILFRNSIQIQKVGDPNPAQIQNPITVVRLYIIQLKDSKNNKYLGT